MRIPCETSKRTTSESHQIERRPVRRTFAATAIYSCVALAAALASQTARVLQSDDEIGHVRALLSRSAQVFEIQPIDVRSFATESAAISSGCFFVTSVWTTCTILPVTARLQTAQSVLMCDGTSRRNEAIRAPRSHAHYLAHRSAQMTHRRVAEAWCAIERHRWGAALASECAFRSAAMPALNRKRRAGAPFSAQQSLAKEPSSVAFGPNILGRVLNAL